MIQRRYSWDQRCILAESGAPALGYPLTGFTSATVVFWRHGGFAIDGPAKYSQWPSLNSITSPLLFIMPAQQPPAKTLLASATKRVSLSFLKCGAKPHGPKPQPMQHGIGDILPQKHTVFSVMTISSFASEVYLGVNVKGVQHPTVLNMHDAKQLLNLYGVIFLSTISSMVAMNAKSTGTAVGTEPVSAPRGIADRFGYSGTHERERDSDSGLCLLSAPGARGVCVVFFGMI